MLFLLVASFGWGREPPVDDAFISYRYAENLAAGRGPVFNPDERVEGYSNPTWVLLLAAAAGLGLPLPAVSRILGLLAALALLPLVRSLARPGEPTEPDRSWSAPLLLALTPALAVWAVRGLETTLYALLLTLGIAGVRRDLRTLRPGWRSLLPLALLSVTRPEGILFAAATAVLFLVQLPPGSRRRWVLWCLGCGMPLGALLLFRRAYFGAWLPLPYYHRLTWSLVLGRPLPLLSLGYLRTFCVENPGLVLLLAAALLHGGRRSRLRRTPVLLEALALQVGFVLLQGFDWMSHHRFLLPVLPAACALVALHAPAWCIPAADRGSPARRSLLRWLAPAVILPALALPHLRAPWGLAGPRELLAPRTATPFTAKRRALAEWTARQGDRPTLAYDDVGKYFWGLPLRALDYGGLVTPGPGRLVRRFPDDPERVWREVADRVFRSRPEVILLRADLGGRGRFGSATGPAHLRFDAPVRAAIFDHPDRRGRYDPWGILRENQPPAPGTGGPGSTFLVFGRKDLGGAPAALAGLLEPARLW